MVKYTDNTLVTNIAVPRMPVSRSRTVSGYGGMIATHHMIKYAGRWHRVYAMVYGNSGSLYIKTKNGDLFLDTDTEYRLGN
jgi:hypothetical protein